MKNILEQIIESKSYEDISPWHLPNISKFSESKTLYEYQKNAIKNITKTLYEFYGYEDGKGRIYREYKLFGLEDNKYSIFENKDEKRFLLYKDYYETLSSSDTNFISESHFLNRACFWMATGSGKSLVIIKTIELLHYLKNENLIPEKDILLLMPRDFLIEQFQEQIDDYNRFNEENIELVNLKDYDQEKERFDLTNGVKVFYYRSDLVRSESKENIVDFKSYENSGNWYILLDEAHRGEKQNSLAQDYISIMSRNGFLFNFSATFTDNIDYLTTCYNFNLKKFIESGYGKNIYFGSSFFQFKNKQDDFSDKEKTIQVLKSLIIFTLIKKRKLDKQNYHWPMMMTLVNSINTEDSDLKLFFKVIANISTNNKKITQTIFEQTKELLVSELDSHDSFVFGDEKLNIESKDIYSIQQQDIFNNVFNSENYGKIEIIEGEKGKELALKLETSDEPFALIKIGDAGKFKREHLGDEYRNISSYDNSRSYFQQLDQSNNINLLIGSRSFYEGWDSDRPNILNLINIGGKDAKKFVLQSTGRGIRIQPKDGLRKRLPKNDKEKEQLLETLFMFASDRKTIDAINETVGDQTNSEEYVVSLERNTHTPTNFQFIVPEFVDSKEKKTGAKFFISEESKNSLRTFVNSFSLETMIIKFSLSKYEAEYLLNEINKDNIFQTNNEKVYSNIERLFRDIIEFTSVNQKEISNLKKVDDEIQHYLQIKLIDQETNEIDDFLKKVKKVASPDKKTEEEIGKLFKEERITFEEMISMNENRGVDAENYKEDIKIINISEHYYLPLIFSVSEKIKIIKNIIKVPSEVKFIQEVEKYLKNNSVNKDWMFSKLSENIDNIHIPYFDGADNKYRKFYPDFIFWFKEESGYRVVFVDPKGVEHSSYMDKVAGFERLFLENNKPKVYRYDKTDVVFDLKLVTNDLNRVTERYLSYWLNVEELNKLFKNEYSTK